MTEPSLLQVMYDSIRNLESAIEELSTGVTSTKLDMGVVRTDIAVIKSTIRHYDKLQADVSDLKRKMWLISVLGGMAAGIITVLVTGFVRDKVIAPPPTPGYNIVHPPQERVRPYGT